MEWTADHEELLKKVNQEWDEYTRSMWELPGYAVLGKADEIAAMGFCYNQLVGYLGDYPVKNVEWLLQFEKPLEAVHSHWMTERDMDFESEFDRVFREWGYEEPESSMGMLGMS